MDTFGKALIEYWKGDHKSKGFYIRDDGSRSQYDIKVYFIDYPDFLNIEKKALKFATGKILDVGCGAGRHTLFLQNKGYDIIGIDTSKLAIEVCKKRGCKKCKVVDIFKNNFKPSSFDTILLMGTNIGIAGTLKRTIRLLKICNKLAKKNGTILLTTKDVNKRKDKNQIEYNQKNIKSGRYVGERKLRFEYKQDKSAWFKWIFIEPKMLQEIALKTGWKVEKIFKSNKDIYSAVLKNVSKR